MAMQIVYLEDIAKTLKVYFSTESANPNAKSPWSIEDARKQLGLSYGATLGRIHTACSGGDPIHRYPSIFRFDSESKKLEPTCPHFLEHYPLREDQVDEARRYMEAYRLLWCLD